MKRVDILLRRVVEMQTALGVKDSAQSRAYIMTHNIEQGGKKKKGLSEYEQALINAHNKLKETEDRVDERQSKVGLFGPNSKEIISIFINRNKLL